LVQESTSNSFLREANLTICFFTFGFRCSQL